MRPPDGAKRSRWSVTITPSRQIINPTVNGVTFRIVSYQDHPQGTRAVELLQGWS